MKLKDLIKKLSELPEEYMEYDVITYNSLSEDADKATDVWVESRDGDWSYCKCDHPFNIYGSNITDNVVVIG